MADTEWSAFGDRAYLLEDDELLVKASGGGGVNILASVIARKGADGNFYARGGDAISFNVATTSAGSDADPVEFGLRFIGYQDWQKAAIVAHDRAANTYGSDLIFKINDASGSASLVERMRLTLNGDLLVGAASGSNHVIGKAGSIGTAILSLTNAAIFYNCDSVGFNAAASALKVWLNSTTGRSINAAGTINASGADYAEYMTKAPGCGTIAKGDVCGVDANGQLVTSWAAAISSVIKSTDPAYVGGDVWGNIGPEPVAPEPVGPAPVLSDVPPPFDEPMPVRGEDEPEAAFNVRVVTWGVALNAAAQATIAYQQQLSSFPQRYSAWQAAKAAFDTAQAQFESDLAAWEAELETARQAVDRIAFSGQVPCNVTGAFAVGDYIIAAEGPDDTIIAIAVPESEISFDQYRKRVGKVWAVREGRAWIDVQHG